MSAWLTLIGIWLSAIVTDHVLKKVPRTASAALDTLRGRQQPAPDRTPPRAR